MLDAKDRAYLVDMAVKDGDIARLEAEVERVKDVCKQINREKNDHFSQGCINLKRAEKAEARVAELEVALLECKGERDHAEAQVAVLVGALEKHKYTFEYLLKGEGKCECDLSVGMAPCFSCALDDAAKDILKAISRAPEDAKKLLAVVEAAKEEVESASAVVWTAFAVKQMTCDVRSDEGRGILTKRDKAYHNHRYKRTNLEMAVRDLDD